MNQYEQPPLLSLLPTPITTPTSAEQSHDHVIHDEEMEHAARQLKALADPVRLSLLQILAQANGTLCVSEVVKHCTLAQPTISWHLRILRDVGLVGVTKQGTYAYYYVKAETLAQVRHRLLLYDQETRRILENPSEQ